MDLSGAYAETTPDRITGRVVDYSYYEESEGHRTEMPIISLRVRDADRQLHEVEVEGFRPFFYITRSEFLEDPAGVLNDRRVIGVEGTFTPNVVAETMDTDTEELGDAMDIAARFSDSTSAIAVHVPSDEMYADLRDRSLVRVFCATPSQVGGGRSNETIRESFDETFEADIPFTRRFSITSGITDGISIPDTDERITVESFRGSSEPYGDLVQEAWGVDPPDVGPRMCIFDIEVATEGGGFPDASRAKQPITAICGYDSYTEQYRLWALESDEWGEDPAEIETSVREDVDNTLVGIETDRNLTDVTVFTSETALLESFHEWFLEHSFDMITGWNSDGFDVPYIIQRSYYRSVTQVYEWQSEGNPAVWKTERNGDETIGYTLRGRITLDMLDAYTKTQFRELPSYQLDDVAQAELGYGKIDLDVDSYDDAWHNHPIDFLKYNIRDVQAVVGIESGKGLMSLYNNIRSVTGADYETCNHNGPTLDTMFLIRADEQQLALPTNTEPDEGVYHGAKVFPTVPGYHPNAVYPDLSSLYPSLFAMLNLGVETIIGSKEDLEESEYTEDDVFRFPVDDRPFATVPKGETYDHIDRKEYKGVKSEQGGLREMFDPEYQWKYALKPDIKESFIRETIDELIDLKYEYTGDMYSAIKRTVNSCYGVLGDSESGGVGSRLYNRQVAEGITLAGRLVIQHTAEEFTEYVQDHYDSEAELIGGDTDSSVTSIPNAPSLQDVKHWSDEAVEYVDASYDEFAHETFWMDPDDDDHRLEVELESVASGLFFIEEDDTGDTEYRMKESGYLESVDDIEGVQKRYAQHIVWDDDDGWIDTPDAPEEWPTPAWDELSSEDQAEYDGRVDYYEQEGYPDCLEDGDDLSDLKYESGCTYDTYDGGPLSGRDPQGDIGIKGFEYVRSDTAQITKEAQLRILTDILLSAEPRDRIEPYIRELVDDVESGRRSLADCARPKGISQPLDQYGWKSIEELDEDDITPQVEQVGGDYVQKAGPTYRGAKYCDDHFQSEELGEGSKPMKIPIETVRSPDGTYPRAYTYESYPRNEGWPDPLEVGDTVDAIAVEDPGSVPEDVFVVDYEKIVTKELDEKLEGMFRTIDLAWDDLIADGKQTGLGAWG